MNRPISCKCVTYGRVDLLEEALYSFINQEYDGPKELVIVNDYPKQKLYFDHPDVKIINLDSTFDYIGDKDNFAVSQCSHDIVAVWDDDDIALSNHLQNINKFFVEGSELLHWQRAVLFDFKKITALTSTGNSGIVFSKKIFNQLGGYPKENAGHDMTLVLKIKYRSNAKVVLASPPDNEISWFYCWGGRSYHMSGLGADTPDRPNIIQRHAEHIESLRLQNLIPTGDIYLQPKWKQNYKELLQNFVSK
jgi:glycosyltransferase involved in cell wall biosynthesis